MLILVSATDSIRSVVSMRARYQTPFMILAAMVAVASAPLDNAVGLSASVTSIPYRLWSGLVSAVSLDGWIHASNAADATFPAVDALRALTDCTYLNFHFVFTVPILTTAWSLAATKTSSSTGKLDSDTKGAFFSATRFWTIVLCFVATAYSLPWDDYLVRNTVWWYADGRVMTDLLVYHTPIEEVAFFSLQTIVLGGICSNAEMLIDLRLVLRCIVYLDKLI